MKISLKNQAKTSKNSDVCSVLNHNMHDEMINFVIVKLTGRYPDARLVTNQTCKEMVYIQSGTGKLVVDGKEHLLNAGDLVLIEPGEKYYWEGNMDLYISCSPAWTMDQHQIVD